MIKKYLIVKIPSSGFSNIILELEIALSISYISNRTLILSDLNHCHGIIPSKSWESIWDVFDQNSIRQEFSVKFDLEENFRNLDSIKNYLQKNNINYKDCYHHTNINNHSEVTYNSSNLTNFEDFENFVNERSTFDVNSDSEYLIVDISLGHFFYNVYSKNRNELKNKINNAIKYKNTYYNIVKNLIKSKYKNYNAIHIRYPWFHQSNSNNEIDIRNNPELLYKRIKELYKKDLPLYISTDLLETSKAYNHDLNIEEYLGHIKKNYQVITVNDLHLSLTKTEKIAIDQIACSMADKFYGTYYSTFSKRINIMRGIAGLSTYDFMGWNKVQSPWMEIKSPYPWKILNISWEWYYSSYLQYTDY